MAKVLTDSGYWIALYTPEEVLLNERARNLAEYIENNDVLIPWPTLYEFVNTRLARRKEALFSFQNFLLKPNVKLISDEKYKELALNQVFVLNKTKHFSISLVDETIRQMISDIDLRIDFFVTFNRQDFEYQCQLRDVDILDQ